MDDDDKVRRNLVVASSIVLLAAWLGMPLATLAERMLGVSAGSPATFTLSPSRFWSAALFMLVYFIVRYRFSSEARKALRAFRRERQLILNHKASRYLANRVSRLSRTGKDSIIFNHRLGETVARCIEEMNQNSGHTGPESSPWGKPKVTVDSIVFSKPYSGHSGLYLEWGEPRRGSMAGGHLAFEIVGAHRVWLSLVTTAQALTYSRSGVQYVVPVALWVLAVTFVVWRVVASSLCG
jgi:hypothetical protein